MILFVPWGERSKSTNPKKKDIFEFYPINLLLGEGEPLPGREEKEKWKGITFYLFSRIDVDYPCFVYTYPIPLTESNSVLTVQRLMNRLNITQKTYLSYNIKQILNICFEYRVVRSIVPICTTMNKRVVLESKNFVTDYIHCSIITEGKKGTKTPIQILRNQVLSLDSLWHRGCRWVRIGWKWVKNLRRQRPLWPNTCW